jgi:hypothetical protein
VITTRREGDGGDDLGARFHVIEHSHLVHRAFGACNACRCEGDLLWISFRVVAADEEGDAFCSTVSLSQSLHERLTHE